MSSSSHSSSSDVVLEGPGSCLMEACLPDKWHTWGDGDHEPYRWELRCLWDVHVPCRQQLALGWLEEGLKVILSAAELWSSSVSLVSNAWIRNAALWFLLLTWLSFLPPVPSCPQQCQWVALFPAGSRFPEQSQQICWVRGVHVLLSGVTAIQSITTTIQYILCYLKGRMVNRISYLRFQVIQGNFQRN